MLQSRIIVERAAVTGIEYRGRTKKCTRVADRAFPKIEVSWRQPGDFDRSPTETKHPMLRRLAQIAMGYPPRPEARCTLCNVKHSVAKPFVEGPNGFLICRNCVAAAVDRLQREPDRQVPTKHSDAQHNVETRQETNPYAPPATAPSHENRCKLCGCEMISFAGHNVMCDACVMCAKELIDVQLTDA